jgi:bromodomain-containing protein 8
LKQLVGKERQEWKRLRHDLELLRNNQMDEKRMKEIWDQKIEKERIEREKEIEHKKWLKERELKIAQMKHMRASPQTLRQKAPIPKTPVNQSLPSVSTVSESTAKSPLNEPLKVDIDSDLSITQTSAIVQSNENKLTLPLSTPSTSPLLTSLLQSPTPSTPTILSPNKSGLSSTTFTRQTSMSQTQPAISSSPIASITRRPSIHSSPDKQSVLNSPEKTESVISFPTAVSPVTSGANNGSAQQITSQSSSPTLSKLLEMPPTPDRKIPPLPIIETQAIQQNQQQVEKSQNQETEQTAELEKLKESNETRIEEICISSPLKSPIKVQSSHSKQDSQSIEETRKQTELNESQIDDLNIEKVDKNRNIEVRDEIQEINKTVDNANDGSLQLLEIKREIIETTAEEQVEKEIVEKVNVKEEPKEINVNMTLDGQKTAMSSVSTRARSRKPQTVSLNITPTVTRRSGRVKARKDLNATIDDSTEVSDQSAANTPQAHKKRGSVDETTETSMSEESMDAKIAITAPLNESLPNSPASSIMQTEDSESLKEYKLWKKSIMLVWRTASTHKNASLFLHPVTDNEAKGYTDIVRQPMDLTTLKKRIENGVIRTTVEFQRDIMLMFQNAIMFNEADHDVHKMAVEMQKETIESIQDFIETQQQNNQSNESKLRARERRSATTITEVRKLKIKKFKFF